MTVVSSNTVRAIDIWKAGVAAVDSQRLVESAVHRRGNQLRIHGEEFDLSSIRRIVVVGAGKAGAGMAAGVEAALGTDLVEAKVAGWVNVPSDCVRPLRRIILHAARPAGLNEPTAAGVFGAEQILQQVSQLGPDDLCLVLISGGGSALMPAPIPEITLEEKLQVSRVLAQAGATIHELNTVRTRLSRIKGGGLLRAIPAGRVVVLLISDVIGDPLDVIASGPTVINSGQLNPLQILKRYCSQRSQISETVWSVLERPWSPAPESRTTARHWIIGNNQTAIDAAANQATALGFETRILATNQSGIAREVGEQFAEACLRELHSSTQAVCLLSGGEPVVQLATTKLPRRGGRNQELVLAAGIRLWNEDLSRISILSGGTDGEDGPTNAAGAWFDADVHRRAIAAQLNPHEFLAINNTYPFFEQTGGLLITGPTHTNVMDLRVGIIGQLPRSEIRCP